MGYTTRTYTIFGVKTEGYDNELSDLYYDSDEVAARGDVPFILFDDLCSGYMILGVCLYEGPGSRWQDEDGDVFKYLPKAQALKKLKAEYIQQFKTVFPGYEHLLTPEWRLMTLEHTV